MKLDEFVINHQINLSDKIISACEMGVDIMRHSVFPLYDERHVFGIISNLDHFLREQKEINKEEINFNVLLLSICWHDVWKTRKFPLNYLSFAFFYLHEGMGSMDMFSQLAEVVGLDKDLVRATKYAIRKHPGFQILPRKTLEAKLLKDLDGLEEWSFKRLEPLRQDYMFLGVMNIKLVRLVKFYFDRFMVNDPASAFYFQWTRAEFKKRKIGFIKEANKTFAEFSYLFPKKKKKKKKRNK
ncbi:MAG: hypothetical protein ABIF89_01625 [bacterium]